MASEVSVPAAMIALEAKTVVGTMYGNANVKQDFVKFIEFAKKGDINLAKMVSRTVGLDEINDAGGLDGTPITLTFRDDETNPDKGVQVVHELIDQVGVKVIIGAVSSRVTLAIGPICQEKGVVMLSPTASNDQDFPPHIF